MVGKMLDRPSRHKSVVRVCWEHLADETVRIILEKSQVWEEFDKVLGRDSRSTSRSVCQIVGPLRWGSSTLPTLCTLEAGFWPQTVILLGVEGILQASSQFHQHIFLRERGWTVHNWGWGYWGSWWPNLRFRSNKLVNLPAGQWSTAEEHFTGLRRTN